VRVHKLLTGLLGVFVLMTAAAGVARATAYPVQYVVVIYQENISFDHYFGTYPNAANPSGEPAFYPLIGTPTVNGLTPLLLTYNPNSLNANNGAGEINPFRLDRSQAFTVSQTHNYQPEQQAFDFGLMDAFPEFVGQAGPPPGSSAPVATTGLTMGYFDGNTVTAEWNYAQRFAMSDNSYGTTFGPSTPGAINLVSGQTNGIGIVTLQSTTYEISDGYGGLTMIDDPEPYGDVCSTTTKSNVQLTAKNIGDLLTAGGVSWGGFTGGFNLSTINTNGTTGCNRSSYSSVAQQTFVDYEPHHNWFQYYASTSNPTHVRPASVAEIGHAGSANHDYDLNDFFTAVSAGNMPAVSFLKAIGAQDAHAGNSDPLDEQTFLVTTINFLQKTPYWKNMAIIIAYDDSDGWYDHQMSPIVNQSNTAADALSGPGACGNGASALPGVAAGTLHAQGRCGFGPRLPLLVISPFAKKNFVDHAITNQTSIIRFIEDNWLGGQRLGGGSFDAISNSITNMFDFDHGRRLKKLILDPDTGNPK